MTDSNVRNVLFDPRCGWVLISSGVYLGTSRATGRSAAWRALCTREVETGLREALKPGERSQRQRESFEWLQGRWEYGVTASRLYDRMSRE